MASGSRERGAPRLIARVGRQEIVGLEPGAELVAQDAGVLQLRFVAGPFGDWWDLTGDVDRRSSGEAGYGLMLVTVTSL